MDIISHAGWGYAVLRSRGKKAARWGALFGAAPDLLCFIPAKIEQILQVGWTHAFSNEYPPELWKANGPPMPAELEHAYLHHYVYTHSLVILAGILFALWLFRRRQWLWLGIPYGLHILMDIPTHERFTTPFLYPISLWTFQGVSWGNPWIFYPNWISLLIALLFVERRFRTS